MFTEAKIDAWLITLNHAPIERLRMMAELNVIPAIKQMDWNKQSPITCSACLNSKVARAPYHRVQNSSYSKQSANWRTQ